MAPGKIGMISQSGTYLSHLYPYLERLDFNFGEGISLGLFLPAAAGGRTAPGRYSHVSEPGAGGEGDGSVVPVQGIQSERS